MEQTRLSTLLLTRRRFAAGLALLPALSVGFSAGLAPRLAAAAPASSGAALLKAFAEKAAGAEGRFTQRTADHDGRPTGPASEGIFAFLRPGCFEWTYEKPYRQKIVSDGKTLWLYDEDLMQATAKPLEGALPATPAAILFGAADLERDWTLKDLPAEDGRPRVRAVPKTEGAFTSVEVSFDEKGLPSRVVFLDSFAQRTEIELSGVALAEPPRSRFDFKPPEGVDVLRDEALF